MVEVTRLNGQRMILNGELIELIESRPDTIVSLTTGRKYIVQETIRELLQKLFEYRNTFTIKPQVSLEEEELYAISKEYQL